MLLSEIESRARYNAKAYRVIISVVLMYKLLVFMNDKENFVMFHCSFTSQTNLISVLQMTKAGEKTA